MSRKEALILHLEVQKSRNRTVDGFHIIEKPPVDPLASISTLLEYFHHF
jgi:hypothetical protein